MVIAKSTYVHDLLRRMLHTDAFRREYLALARGAFPDDSGTVDLPIGRDEAAPTKRAVTPDGQPSRTEYTVLERFPAGVLLLSLIHIFGNVWWCFPIAEIVSACATAFFLRRALRNMDRELTLTEGQ